jgi:hypothetical protein
MSEQTASATPADALSGLYRQRKSQQRLAFAFIGVPQATRALPGGGTPQSGADTPSSQAAYRAQSSRSFIRMMYCAKAKRVRFLRNGDLFFKGIWYAVANDRLVRCADCGAADRAGFVRGKH